MYSGALLGLAITSLVVALIPLIANKNEKLHSIISQSKKKKTGVFLRPVYPWLSVTRMFQNGQSDHYGVRKTFQGII